MNINCFFVLLPFSCKKVRKERERLNTDADNTTTAMDESEEVSAEGDVSGGSFLGQGGDLMTDSGGGDLMNDLMGDDSQIGRSSSLC
jgi:hypothetical protein